jgi:hypothetical protein
MLHLVGWFWKFKMVELVPRCEPKASTLLTEAPSNTLLKSVNNNQLKPLLLVLELQVQATPTWHLLRLAPLNDLQLLNLHNNHSTKDNRESKTNHLEVRLPVPSALPNRLLLQCQSQLHHSLRQMLSTSHLTRRMRNLPPLRLLMELPRMELPMLHRQLQRLHLSQ